MINPSETLGTLCWVTGRVESVAQPRETGPVHLVLVTMRWGKECPVEIKCWRNEGDVARGLREGQVVMVSGELDGRRYQGRVYTDVVATAIYGVPQAMPLTAGAPVGGQPQPPIQPQAPPSPVGPPDEGFFKDDDIPF